MNLQRLLVLCGLFVVFLFPAQAADKNKKKDPMDTTNWRQWNPDPAPVYTAEESLKMFKVAPGFRVELVAAAPLIKDPVFARWDMQGRLWVCEFQSYMRDAHGNGENDHPSRVRVLEDTDGDGRMDKATTFLGGVINPRSLSVVEGGALVALGSGKLVFCEDRDGDLVSEKQTELIDFATSAKGNIEHAENGMHIAIDNWMYNSKSKRRLRWQNETLSVTDTRSRGQWGMATDAFGRLYHNSNSSWFSTDSEIYDGQYGSPGAPTKSIRAIRTTTALNRAYKVGMIKEDGRINGVTSISGLAVHSDGAFGADWQGAIFSFSPGCNAVGAFVPDTAGMETRKYKHMLYPDQTWTEREFLASSDERFRPVNGSFGPDGCLTVVDFYRGIIQHKKFLTRYLRAQSIERELDQHIGDGRIWRVVPEDYQAVAAPENLVAGLSHPHLWWRLHAQKSIVESSKTELIPVIRSLALKGETRGRAHALWTLSGLGKLDAELIRTNLEHDDDFVRMTALRLAGETTPFPAVFPEAFKPAAQAIADSKVGGDDAPGRVRDYARQLVGKGYPDRFASIYKDKMPGHISNDKAAAAIYGNGLKVYNQFCAACHQPHGKGTRQLAPSLVKSDWVNGSPLRLLAVTMHGLTGPIHVNGKVVEGVPPVMPPHSFLTDEQLAATLSYVRNAWGNKADVVEPEAVAAFRKKHAGRTALWTEAELAEAEKGGE